MGTVKIDRNVFHGTSRSYHYLHYCYYNKIRNGAHIPTCIALARFHVATCCVYDDNIVDRLRILSGYVSCMARETGRNKPRGLGKPMQEGVFGDQTHPEIVGLKN